MIAEVKRRELGLLLLLALSSSHAGCDKADKKGGKPAVSRSRVNAVAASSTPTVSAEGFCDVLYAPGKGPALQLPALAGDAQLAGGAGWRWINLWATWCKPCIEEMPRLLDWQKKLASKGLSVDLSFVSADADDAIVADFRAKHPNLPPTPRLADPEGLPTWLDSLGIQGASLPVQLFVDADESIRCIRSSAVSAHELEGVADLLGR